MSESSADLTHNTERVGLWSMVATYFLCLLAAYITNGFTFVIPELQQFLQGRLQDIPKESSSFVMLMPVVLAIVAVLLPIMFICLYLIRKVYGPRGEHHVERALDQQQFFSPLLLPVTVLAEEFCARELFLGSLSRIPLLSDPITFYILAITGNAVWSLLHIYNNVDPKDQRFLRAVPYFVGGIFFTYAYTKYGLLGAFFTHFVHNLLLFGHHKLQPLSRRDWRMIVSSAILTALSYGLMDKPLTDVLRWLSNQAGTALPGWGFWDYAKLVLFLNSACSLVLDLLCYDRPTLSCLPIVTKQESGSAMARLFWKAIPVGFVVVCSVRALGIWQGLGLLMLLTAFLGLQQFTEIMAAGPPTLSEESDVSS